MRGAAGNHNRKAADVALTGNKRGCSPVALTINDPVAR